MTQFDSPSLHHALNTLGNILLDREMHFEVVAIGGSGLLLLGMITRPTKDVDQICFKLYAAVDQGPDSKHFADLKSLKPTATELKKAAKWCKTHDVSDGFEMNLSEALTALGS